jgi:hypothetical protein
MALRRAAGVGATYELVENVIRGRSDLMALWAEVTNRRAFMEKYCERKPTLWLRFVAHSHLEAYLSLGWVECGALPFPHGQRFHLIEWPVDRGEPVEPPLVEHR